jgi:hypothetical protein
MIDIIECSYPEATEVHEHLPGYFLHTESESLKLSTAITEGGFVQPRWRGACSQITPLVHAIERACGQAESRNLYPEVFLAVNSCRWSPNTSTHFPRYGRGLQPHNP